jgi:HAD superfamily hydrolase (TIGR01490 family)
MLAIAAFFDIDGTLYREGLITAMFKKLIRSEIIDEVRWHNEVKERYNRWDRRVGNYDDYLLKMAEIYVEAIAGLHQSQIELIAKKVVEQNGDRVYVYTRDRIQFHKEMGHIIITVSGSPEELVCEMASKHGFHDHIGTRYLKNSEGYFTGQIIPMWDSDNKAEAIRNFAIQYGLDLSNSYAYGDTAGDLSMFKMVGFPTAVNPTRELLMRMSQDPMIRAHARVVVERKDMIYEMDEGFFDRIG